MQTARPTVALLAALALLGPAAPAKAETINCTPINAVPAVITLPGNYCLTHALVTSMTSGYAIDIQANNVVIDFNGFRLGGLGAGPGTDAMGIHALNRQNITVRNGTIRGFLLAILIESSGGSQGHLIEDVRADLHTVGGIQVQGTGSIIRNNQVVAVGGSTRVLGPDVYITGVVVVGNGNRVINNDVITIMPTGGRPSAGVVVYNGSDGLVLNNRITNAGDYGIVFGIAGTGKYRDNLTSAVTTPYTGGTDAGNNN